MVLLSWLRSRLPMMRIAVDTDDSGVYAHRLQRRRLSRPHLLTFSCAAMFIAEQVQRTMYHEQAERIVQADFVLARP